VITATITVFNTAPDAAEELVLALPLPADARAAAKDPAATATGWIWPLGTLKPGAQATVTATLQLDQVPVGEALILQPAALARGLVLPVATTGGALVTTTPESKPGPAPTTTRATRDVQGQPPLTPAPQPGPPSDSGTVRFTPGQAVQLRSSDGRITVTFPDDAFDRPLTLVQRTPTQQRPVARGRGQAEPPDIAGFHRGFGAFHLEATDDAGQPVTQFKRPVTLTLRFTPQQLQVLGIPAEALRIFWFDADRVVERGKSGVIIGEWVPQPTVIDAEAGMATLTISHHPRRESGWGEPRSQQLHALGLATNRRKLYPYPRGGAKPGELRGSGQSWPGRLRLWHRVAALHLAGLGHGRHALRF